MSVTITACMIVKDEEERLPVCLESLKGWVDEIVVVDTGSTDKTMEIAKSYGAIIYEQPWQNDFSFHRNYSLSLATGDWCFVIDADEYVDVEEGLIFKDLLPDIKEDVIVVDLLSVYGSKREVKSRHPSVRFARRSYDLKYDRPVHNRAIVKPGTRIYRMPFKVYHTGYDLPPEDMEAKYLRTSEMCRQLTIDSPDSPVSWLHYAKILKVRDGKFNEPMKDELIRVIQTGLDLCNGENDRQNIYLQLLFQMAWVYHVSADHLLAIKYAKRALVFKHDYLDAIFVVGMSLVYGVDSLQGEEWLKRYLKEQEIYTFSDKVDSVSMEHCNERILVYKTLIRVEGWKVSNCKLTGLVAPVN